MISRFVFAAALAGALAFGAVAAQDAQIPSVQPGTPVASYRVVRTYPHDTDAFTEGLLYRNGQLFESTGINGRSSIRRVDLATGRVVQQRDLDARYFGEGIVVSNNRLIQLTWRSQIGFIYDLASFKPIGSFRYAGEGWSLTMVGNKLVMSDGTAELRLIDPDTLKETGRLRVLDQDRPVPLLNELEYVRGEILANVFQTDLIARINPKTGKVNGWIDLSGLLGQPHGRGVPGEPDVLNGIAYDAAGDRLFVTGKLWPKVYEIKLMPKRR